MVNSPPLRKAAAQFLERIGVELLVNERVKEANDRQVGGIYTSP